MLKKYWNVNSKLNSISHEHKESLLIRFPKKIHACLKSNSRPIFPCPLLYFNFSWILSMLQNLYCYKQLVLTYSSFFKITFFGRLKKSKINILEVIKMSKVCTAYFFLISQYYTFPFYAKCLIKQFKISNETSFCRNIFTNLIHL